MTIKEPLIAAPTSPSILPRNALNLAWSKAAGAGAAAAAGCVEGVAFMLGSPYAPSLNRRASGNRPGPKGQLQPHGEQRDRRHGQKRGVPGVVGDQPPEQRAE